MTFKEAENKLKGLAGEGYYKIGFDIMYFAKKLEAKPLTSCSLIVEGYSYHTGVTFEEAFSKLEQEINPLTDKQIEEMKP